MSIVNNALRIQDISFLSSGSREAEEARGVLIGLYGGVAPEEADIIVALGGDGLMLQTLHRTMDAPKPIYGMNNGHLLGQFRWLTNIHRGIFLLMLI